MKFPSIAIAVRKMLPWWGSKRSSATETRKTSLEILFRVTAMIVCNPHMAALRAVSDAWIIEYFQNLAEKLCQREGLEESKGFEEPPDIHQHPEPMPFDYNDWKDHMGRHVARHNYH